MIGVVLAGGRSSRMGRDKATLPFAGQTLLAHMQQRLREAGAREVWISGPTGVVDGVSAGPLSGVVACLRQAVSMGVGVELLLFVPVDMPLIRAESLARLARAPATLGDGPLPLLLDATALDVAEAQLASSDRSLRSLCRALGVARVEVDVAELRGANTPAELLALIGAHQR